MVERDGGQQPPHSSPETLSPHTHREGMQALRQESRCAPPPPDPTSASSAAGFLLSLLPMREEGGLPRLCAPVLGLGKGAVGLGWEGEQEIEGVGCSPQLSPNALP